MRMEEISTTETETVEIQEMNTTFEQNYFESWTSTGDSKERYCKGMYEWVEKRLIRSFLYKNTF